MVGRNHRNLAVSLSQARRMVSFKVGEQTFEMLRRAAELLI
jgi:hypothetical protein